MARFLAAMAMLICLVLYMTAPGNSASNTEAALRAAISNPSIKSFTLTEDLVLTDDLPILPANKVFKLKGAKLPKGKQVKIDGRGKYNLFNNTDGDVVSLTLVNLYITGTKAAAVKLNTLNTKLTVNDVTFAKLPRALELYLVQATVTGSRFVSASNVAVYIESVEGEPDFANFKNCQFVKNKGPGDFTGGAAIYGNLYATINVESSKFVDNSARYVGGAVRLRTSYGSIRKSEFINNFAQEGGGAVSVYNGAVTISNSYFKGNKAGTNGGALRAASDGDANTFISALKSVFEKNRAPNGAGGVFLLNELSKVIFCSSKFKDNTGKSGVSNGFVVGTENTIITTPKLDIPAISLAPDANVTFTSGQKCEI